MTAQTTAPRVSIVLPAHNEIALLGSTVTNLCAGLEWRAITHEVIVVENGSSDGTLRLARVLAAQLPAVRVLSLARGDYGAALEAGIRAALGSIVVTFDVDYYDLSFLDDALALLDSNDAALVVASKRAPGASDRRPLARRALTWAFTSTLRGLLELGVSDAHGMKAMDRAAIAPILDQSVLRDSVFDVELVLRAERAGLAVMELPASVQERRPPRSPLWKRIAHTTLDLGRLRVMLGPGPSKTVRRGPAQPGSLAERARSVARRVSDEGARRARRRSAR